MMSVQYLREFDPPGFQLDQSSHVGWFDQYYKAFIWDNKNLMSAFQAAWESSDFESELHLLKKLNQQLRNLYVLGKIIFDIENGGIEQALSNNIRLFPYFMSSLHDIGAVRSEAAFGEILCVLKREGTDVREPIDEWQEASINAIEDLENIYYGQGKGSDVSMQCLDEELAEKIRLFIQNNINFLQIIRGAH